MQGFMIGLGSMSFQAGIVIIAVLALRKIFEKLHIGKKIIMLLWLLPFLCLVFPWKFSAPVGFWRVAPTDVAEEGMRQESKWQGAQRPGQDLPDREAPQENVLPSASGTSGKQETAAKQEKDEDTQGVVSDSTGGRQSSVSKADGQTAEGKSRFLIWFFSSPVAARILGGVWLFGILALLAGNVVRYTKLRRKLLCSIQIEKNVYMGDAIGSPIVVGFFRPRIYLPSGFPEAHRTYALSHERTHIRRGDMFFKMAVYVITCIHWFNPLVWYGFYLFGKDMEMACDEETVERLGIEEKEAYAKALLDVAEGSAFKSRIIFVAPVAFEEGDVKSRIKNIMKYRKTAVILSVCAVVVCILAAGVFFVKKEPEKKEPLLLLNSKYLGQSYELYGMVLEGLIQEEARMEPYRKTVSQDKDEDEIGVNPSYGDVGALYDKGKLLTLNGSNYDRKIFDSEEENPYTFITLYETTADITHDGTDDLIQVIAYVDKEEEIESMSAHDLIEHATGGVEPVLFKGLPDGTFEKTPRFVGENVHGTHAGNGTWCLCHKDGQDYLLYGEAYEIQGTADYFYKVFYVDDIEGVVTEDKQEVFFATDSEMRFWKMYWHREDVVPEFREKIQPYIESGILLISYDVDTDPFYSTKERECPATEYYDTVWERKDYVY